MTPNPHFVRAIREKFRELSAAVLAPLPVEGPGARERAIAKTKLEEAELWVLRGLDVNVEAISRGLAEVEKRGGSR